MWRQTTSFAALCLLALAGPAHADGGGGAAYPGKPAGGTPAPTPLPPAAKRPAPAPTPAPAPGALLRLSNGRAIAPRGTPRAVRRMIVAANRLVRKRYRWGGGHREFTRGLDRGYDCSGAVS